MNVRFTMTFCEKRAANKTCIYNYKEVRLLLDDLGIRLQRLRAETGMKQADIADKIGVGRSTYNSYENSKIMPAVEVLSRIADAYNVSTDYLLGKTMERRSSGDELAKRLDTLAYLCNQNDARPVEYAEMLGTVNALIEYYHTRQRAGNTPTEYTHKLLAALTAAINAASNDSLSALHIATNDLILAALDASRDIMSVYMK